MDLPLKALGLVALAACTPHSPAPRPPAPPAGPTAVDLAALWPGKITDLRCNDAQGLHGSMLLEAYPPACRRGIDLICVGQVDEVRIQMAVGKVDDPSCPGVRGSRYVARSEQLAGPALTAWLAEGPRLTDDPRLHALLAQVPAGQDFDLVTGREDATELGRPTVGILAWHDPSRYPVAPGRGGVTELLDEASARAAAAARRAQAAWLVGERMIIEVHGTQVRWHSEADASQQPTTPLPAPGQPMDGQVDPDVAAVLGFMPASVVSLTCSPANSASILGQSCDELDRGLRTGCLLELHRQPWNHALLAQVGSFDRQAIEACFNSWHPGASREGELLVAQEGQARHELYIGPGFVVLDDIVGESPSVLDAFAAPPPRLLDLPRARRVLARVHGEDFAVTLVDDTGASLGVPSVSMSDDAGSQRHEYASAADAEAARDAWIQRFGHLDRKYWPTVNGLFLDGALFVIIIR